MYVAKLQWNDFPLKLGSSEIQMEKWEKVKGKGYASLPMAVLDSLVPQRNVVKGEKLWMSITVFILNVSKINC